MVRWILSVFCVGLLAGAAQAEPVDQNQARKLLFSANGAELVVERDSGLDATQLAIVEAILKQMRAEAAANYYGAVAVSPTFFEMMAADPGQAALSGLLQISEKFHSAGGADAAALQACKAARKSSQAKCVLAARVMPKNWTARSLQMSVSATQAFRDYRKGKGVKAFAISATTTAFSAAKGEGAAEAALARCNTAAEALGTPDCEIVIKD